MGNTLSTNYTYEDTILPLGPGMGSLRGKLVDGRVKRFTGVPYAKPPTGEYRWRKTRPLDPDHVYASSPEPGGNREPPLQPLDCTRFSAQAWQTPMQLPFGNKEGEEEGGGPRYDEDCLMLNIWMPAGGEEGEGRPMGNPCMDDISDPTELISSAALKCIFIAPAYRLGVFGFLASQELADEAGNDGDDGAGGVVGNYGMWDQWTAMRWVQRYGAALGGDLSNVTLAGMSAGAYSVHAQVAHALLMEKDQVGSSKSLAVKRIALAYPWLPGVRHSNAIPTNPKSLHEVQPQFNELLAVHGISQDLPGKEKLAALRRVGAKVLTEKVKEMERHTFRPVADGKFFPKDLFKRFIEGEFANEFEKRGMSVLVGEVLNEECTYRMGAPKEMSGLRAEIANLYPGTVTDKLIHAYTVDKIQVPAALPDPNPHIGATEKLYGDIVSDGQVRAPERLLIQQLREAGVPLSRVHRYLIGFKPTFVKKVIPDMLGVPHGSDGALWNYAVGFVAASATLVGTTRDDKQVMTEWISDLVKFVNGKEMDYGTTKWSEQKFLGPDGNISIRQDRKWDYLMQVAHLMADE
ncbi:hypothetical protein QFC21_006931 [Naganishia friedmannii]|uniref:Uncharacterized protein n=1 Tax=Naganishia friedmannii TaxID=89922 RepID=A0ACC2V0E6_9TREE|nr:hypothetical protein QFC21_006931 [Naganishia friedmannii]